MTETQFVGISRNNYNEYKGLLTKAYRDVYAPVFPVGKGGETLESWQSYLSNPQNPLEYRIIVAGENLTSEGNNPVIKGMVASIYYSVSDTALLAYLAVDRQYRQEGLGRKLTQLQAEFLKAAAHEHGKDLDGWFLACDDPAELPIGFDNYNSQKLVDKYVSWGLKVLPFQYMQPDFEPGAPKVADYILLSGPDPVTGQHGNTNAVLSFLESIYKELGITQPHLDKDFIAARQQLECNMP